MSQHFRWNNAGSTSLHFKLQFWVFMKLNSFLIHFIHPLFSVMCCKMWNWGKCRISRMILKLKALLVVLLYQESLCLSSDNFTIYLLGIEWELFLIILSLVSSCLTFQILSPDTHDFHKVQPHQSVTTTVQSKLFLHLFSAIC